jgi:hypothetical protein
MSIYIRPASEWGARADLVQAGNPMPSGPKSLVVLHHTYRPHRHAGEPRRGEWADILGVDKYHRNKGWDGIGYHFAGFQSGNLYACRPVTRTGAHCLGQNSKSIGYVLFIDGDVHTPTAAAIETFRDWLEASIASGLLAADVVIRPHRDFADTSCPGKFVTPLIPAMRG